MTAGHLLIIEDEQRLRDTLETLLSEEGYRITTAADGQEGIQYLQHNSVDVVITDIKMEGLDGFGVMEYVATHTPEIPVIVITAYASTESVLTALRQGAYDYITKPFEFELMQVTIERALEKVRLQRQLAQRMTELKQRLDELTTTTVSKHFVDNIIRSMADMLFVLNLDGTICTVNGAAAHGLGYTADELLGRSWGTLHPASQDPGPRQPADLAAGEVCRYETTLLAREGRQVAVSLARSPLYDHAGSLQGYVCVAQDITERQQAHEALRASEAWLRLLTTQIPAVVWTTDTTLKLTAFLGTGTVMWHSLSASQDKDDTKRWAFFQADNGAEFVLLFASRRVLRGEAVAQEVEYGERTFHAHIEPLRDAQGNIIGTIGVALDITERQWQEAQRRKIAYEIHDGIAQLLVSAQQHLDTFTMLWHHGDAPAQAQLNKGVDRLNQAIVEARHLMAHLRPVALETQGLLPAIRWCLEEIGQEAGWEMEWVENVKTLTLSPEKEALAFRIVQEALTNVWKHAHTSKVRVECTTDNTRDRALWIVIQDWGLGFDPNNTPSCAQHLGLLSMQERAQMLGGTCVIESSPGQGTTVRLHVPHCHE